MSTEAKSPLFLVRIVCTLILHDSVRCPTPNLRNWKFMAVLWCHFSLVCHFLHACTQRRSMCLIISDSDIARMNMLWGIHDANNIKYNATEVKHFLLRASVLWIFCLRDRISLFFLYVFASDKALRLSGMSGEEFNKKVPHGDDKNIFRGNNISTLIERRGHKKW